MKIKDMVTFDVNGKKCVALFRKLTEKECFKLMGVDDDKIEVIRNCGVSRSAMYKMAGNSIVVDVLYHISDLRAIADACAKPFGKDARTEKRIATETLKQWGRNV